MDGTQAGRFRGWWIVAVGFVTQALAVGVIFGSFPVFLPVVAEAFDVGLGEVTLGMSILMFINTAVGAVVGPLLDRFSIRAIMLGGVALQALCLQLMSQATELWQLGALFGIGIALGLALYGPLASATLVAKWFERQIGRAQGVTNMGGPAGVGLFSFLGGYLLSDLGWRETLSLYARVVLVALPLVWFVVRSRPQDIGQLPDGVPPLEGSDAEEVLPAKAASALLRTPTFWLLVLPVSLLMGIAAGWTSQVIALGEDLGFDNAGAANIFGGSALLGIFGTLVFGGLSDRVPGRSLLWVVLGFYILGFCALAFAPVAISYYGVVPILGFLGGGMMPTYAALIGRLFGPASFGQVMGLAGLVMAPIAVAAPALGAWLRDETGSYDTTLLCFALGMLVAGLLLLGLRVPPTRRSEPLTNSTIE